MRSASKWIEIVQFVARGRNEMQGFADKDM